MQGSLRASAKDVALRCCIAASARVRATDAAVAEWRKNPVKHGAIDLPASLFKHADDQTVVGLRALILAVAAAGWQQNSFCDWGVVAAPNLFGRITTARTIERFQKEGAWGVSPHLIPHQSLHAVSGTISQALAIHGPNFGVGSGPNTGPDAFLLATSLLGVGNLPGVWVVLTGYESEWIPARDTPTPPPSCHGVALALTPWTRNTAGRCLTIRHARPSVSPSALYADFRIGAFAEELTGGSGQWRLSDSHWLNGPGGSAMKNAPTWITGVGALTSLGHTYNQIAEALLNGTSGVAKISAFDVADHPSQIGATIGAVPCPAGWDESEFAALSKLDQATLWCCATALADAGWWERRQDVRIGIVLGTAAEWTFQWENDCLQGGDQIYRTQENVEPLSQRAARRLGLIGPAVSLSAACASGNYAIAMARRWLELGWVDVCLAGACDLAITPMTLAGFGNLRALSRRNDAPAKASRPFDQDRDGFVMGEGGAMFVLERADKARRRKAYPYAEVAGCGASSDAHHMVIPSPHPEPAIAAMKQALTDAKLDASAVDYVNAHATSTPVGDQAEVKVLQSVFGNHIEKLPVSSTKSMTGHLLTAAAAVEALACIIALDRQTVPPTINLDNPDPECKLRHVPKQAQTHPVQVTASNSFGFGGSNTCLVLKAA